MAPSRGVIEDKDAKHLLDSIGKIVHEKVKKEADGTGASGDAKNYIEELKGNLQHAKGMGERASSNKTCALVKQYYERDENIKRYPCGNGSASDKRFSVKQQAEYDNKKMKCSNGGACAPYRRLHLCDKNLENMDTNNDGKAKHDLLLEVCMAAYHEGDSIKTHHPQHQVTYPGYHSQICTELARSFADIGDIIRGRDLYRGGNSKEKKKREDLENKLKDIFQKIHDDVTKEKRSRYNGDKNNNYYQLREDWWTANRSTVWKAITCKAEQNDKYFRNTCNGGEQTKGYCRCNDDKPGVDKPNIDPPTYFDYVPQYLRWFEEWAEDFCRKKKKKLENLQKQCRKKDKNSDDRYCSRNGYDCEQTVNARGKVRMGKGCTDCFFACYPYVDWIEKQKEQFDKQKKIYDKEIKKYTNGGGGGGSSRAKRAAGGATTTNYEGYESKFYKILKTKGGVGEFLDLLSKEEVCKNFKEKEEGKIDFKTVKSSSASGGAGSGGTSGTSGTNNASQGTFYRSEYCQPCPICGMKKNNGEWEHKKSGRCTSGNLYTPKKGVVGTTINFLYSGDETNEIAEKLKKFCETKNGSGSSGGGAGGSGTSGRNELYQKWTCYHDVEKVNNGEDDDEEDMGDYANIQTAGGLCILPNPKKNKEKSEAKSQNNHADIQKTYNDFFYYWVVHMLKDSIHWRTKKLDKCLKKGTKIKCTEKCKTPCDCFESWVQQKEQEWNAIKEHFKKQKDFDKEGNKGNHTFLDGAFSSPDFVLQQVLKKEVLLTSLQEGYGNAKDIKHIEALLKEEEAAVVAAIARGENKTTIDKLLQHEAQEAKDCQSKHQDPCPLPEEDKDLARSEDFKQPTPSPDHSDPAASEDLHDSNAEEDEEDEDDDDDNLQEASEEAAEEVQVGGEVVEDQGEVKPVPPGTTPTVDNVKPACDIVSKLFSGNDFGDACGTKYDKYGKENFPNWKCVTPSGPTSGDQKATSGDTTGGSVCVPPRRRKLYLHDLQSLIGKDGTTPTHEQLLEWFVKSAAVETFFAWHKFKKENTKRQGVGSPLGGMDGPFSSVSQEEDPPEKQLQKSGTIPPDFLRQMFYTLGDYRDICVGKTPDGIDTVSASDKDRKGEEKSKMTTNEISRKIKEFLQKQNSDTAGSSSGNDPESWWQKNGEHIWNGMVCALTYTDSEEKGKQPQQNESVKKAFFGENNNGNPGTTGNTEGTYEKTYKYDKVQLKEENDTEVKGQDDSQTTQAKPTGGDDPINNPKLTQFVLRPPYFRYLHEWGQNFCKKRTEMLEKIKEECMDEDGIKQKYSGDGEECKIEDISKKKLFAELYGSSCAKSCRSYKKWIKKKGKEYEKQKEEYSKQKEKCQTQSNKAEGNNGGNGFCVTQGTCNEAKHFLQKLASCKKDSGKDILDFNNPEQTFRPATNCAPCSEFKINCENCKSSGGGNTQGNCNGGTITAEKFYTMVNSPEEVVMRFSDNSAKGFDDGLDACKDAHIFKSIKENKWECRKVCGVDICTLEKKDTNGQESGKKYIIMKEFLKRWLENFFEDYNRIHKKLKPCIENGNGNEDKCFKGCKENCECVGQWIEKKKEEWNNIRKQYVENYEKENEDGNNLNSFLQQGLFYNEVQKAIKPCTEFNDFQKSKKCTETANTVNKKGKGSNKKDGVLCLLDRLKTKVTACPGKPIDNQTETECQKPPLVEDDDDPLEEEEQNQVKAPEICGDMKTQPPETVVEEEKCEQADTPSEKDKTKDEGDKDKKDDGEKTSVPSTDSNDQTNRTPGSNPEQTPILKPEEKPVPEAPAIPTPSQPTPPQVDEPFNRDILEKTIPLGIALALGSIAFLFLKKEKKKEKKENGNIKFIKIKKINFDKKENEKLYQKKIKKKLY